MRTAVTGGPSPRGPVLLHGFTGSSGTWPARLVESLRGAGRRPVCVDLPGHGRHAGEHGPERFTLDAAFAEIEMAFGQIEMAFGEIEGASAASETAGAGDSAFGRREAAAGGADARSRAIEPAFTEIEAVAATRGPPSDLVGYSMGGRIALHFSLAFPARVGRLVLESASPGIASEGERVERRRADDELASLLEREGIEPFVDAWETRPLFASQSRLDGETRARHRRLRLANHAGSLAAALRGLGSGSLPSLWERLGEVAVPTLLVAGALDRKFVGIAERMAAAMPDAHLTVIPDVGHAVHLERPDAWLEAVVPFLEERAPTRAARAARRS